LTSRSKPERRHGKAPKEAIFQASLLRFAYPDDHAGGDTRRPAAAGGQRHRLGAAPTAGARHHRRLDREPDADLFTTPVIYLLFDRLSQRLSRTPREPSAGERGVNIPALFIKRPVATTLLAIAIGLSGLLAYFHLPVAPLPNVTFRSSWCRRTWPAQVRKIMASTVADPLERRLATIAGVTELTSTNFVGSSMVVVQFDLKPRHQRRGARCGSGDSGGARRPADHAAQQSHLSRIQSGGFAHSHSVVDVEHLDDGTALRFGRHHHPAAAVADRRCRPDYARRQRLALVRVELEPDKLSSYGIGLEDVRAAIAAANADSAKGHIDQGDQRLRGDLQRPRRPKAADYRDLVIAYRKRRAGIPA